MRNLLTQNINKNEIKGTRRRGTKKKYSNFSRSHVMVTRRRQNVDGNKKNIFLVGIIKDEQNKKIAS